MKLDARTARCSVHVCREGILAAAGHDLRLDVRDFEISVDVAARTVSARFDARSLRVVAAMVDGQERPGLLSDADCRTIEGHVLDVLATKRFPSIELVSSRIEPIPRDAGVAAVEAARYRVDATLTLHGVHRSVAFVVHEEGDKLVARVRLLQTDYGIRPFSAMLGTLRVKPQVDVAIELPRPELPAPSPLPERA